MENFVIEYKGNVYKVQSTYEIQLIFSEKKSEK